MPKYKCLIIFLLVFIIFLSWQLIFDKIIGSDVFYHFKISELIKNGQINSNFPNLTLTILNNNNYVDHHLLFHYLILPFNFLPDFISIKIAITFYLSLLLTFFYWLLSKLGIKYKLFWLILLLISSSTFLFRLQLGRPQTISIILFIFIFYFLVKKRGILLMIATTLLTLLFNGFHIIFILIIPFLIIDFLISKKINLSPFLFGLLGVIVGLVIHPSFPKNMQFWLNHGIITTFKNISQNILPIGVEWSGFTLQNFLLNNTILTLILITSIIPLFLLKINQRQSPLSKERKMTLSFLGIGTLLFLILTFFARRFIDYLVPLAVLLTAYLYSTLSSAQLSPEIKTFLSQLSQKLKKPWLKYFLIIAVIVLIIHPFKTLYASYQNAYPVDRYKTTAEWLKNNTPEHSIIFHSSWDAFPRLFFWNHHNYYLVGMDPTFMYLYDENLYWQWRHITEDVLVCNKELTNDCDQNKNTPADIAEAIKTDFNSEYIWVNDYPIYEDFKKFLNDNSDYFEKMIETEDSAVFKIITPRLSIPPTTSSASVTDLAAPQL